MNPTDILQRVNERYSQCRSYSDSGIVEFDDVHQNREHIEFKTEFVRPDYFRFEWQDYGPNRGKSERFSMLWSNGEKHVMRLDNNKPSIRELPSLGMGVAGATGCSAGAAHIVPALLIDELRIDSKHLLLLTDLEPMTEETLDDLPCYVLKGSLMKEGDHVLWISKDDFCLMRVRSDKSRTAEESERELKALIANTDLMAKLTERGIAPPNEVKHIDTRQVAEYIYTNVSFDGSIVRAPQPVAT
jgi:hypothetical protein